MMSIRHDWLDKPELTLIMRTAGFNISQHPVQ